MAVRLCLAFLSSLGSRRGSYVRRWPRTPSGGKTGLRVSGGVFTGVMMVAALAGGATGAVSAMTCMASYGGGLAGRGLGSVPGGDESELVMGVRALGRGRRAAGDMVEAAESTSPSRSRASCVGDDCGSRGGARAARLAVVVVVVVMEAEEAKGRVARCEAVCRSV